MNENAQAIKKEKLKRWVSLLLAIIFFAGLMSFREEFFSTWLRSVFSAIAAVVLAMDIMQFQQRKVRANREDKGV